MNLVQLAPMWLVAIFCAVVIAAAIDDALRFRISNLTVLAVIATAGVAVGLTGWSPSLWQNLLIFVVLLGGGTLLFASGKMGGGDVKLFAAVGLWVDLDRAWILLAAVFVFGGLLALIVISRRLLLPSTSGHHLSAGKRSVPYGVAIAMGALTLVVVQRQLGVAPQSEPLKLRPLNVAFDASPVSSGLGGINHVHARRP